MASPARVQPLLLWKALERPVKWEVCFGRRAPLLVEIGFGSGEYLVRCAGEYPGCDFVGIETHWPSVKRTWKRVSRSRLTNVRLLQVDARVALERLFLPGSLAGLTSLFPCPWPKQKHTRHRLFSRAFLKLCASRLTLGAELLVVTDWAPFVDWIEKQVPGTGFGCQKRLIPPLYTTRYERKWQAQGRGEFVELRLLCQTEASLPLKEDDPVHTHLIKEFCPESLPPPDLHQPLLNVIFKSFLFDPLRNRAMQRVIVSEEGLTQDFWVAISGHDRGFRIHPARGCSVVPTRGVQRALDLVRDALEHRG